MSNHASVNSLRTHLHSSALSPGTFLGLGSTAAIEVAALAGCEWAVLDLEHGGGTTELVGPSVQAAKAAGIPLIVRVSSPERAVVGWMIDQGVAGVMVPRIESLEHAREVVSYFDYPPHGQRGVASYTRAAGWGSSSVQDTARALCIVQIETAGALREVEAIAALDGVDALFIGPLDLSFALGVPEDLDSEAFTSAFKRIVDAGLGESTPVGSLASESSRAAAMAALGIGFLALGSDALLLRHALRDHISSLTEQAKSGG